MMNGETRIINGAWSEEDNAWVSETLCLTGVCRLEADLPDKGRLVIKKSESENGPFPKAYISRWGGTSFIINIYGTTRERYIRIYLTETPTSIKLVS